MEYREARKYIDEACRFGGKMGLEAVSGLLERLGNPQKDLKFVHIAGTNGKGSTGAYMGSVLQEAGYRVGRFISPTLYEYRERIQINGRFISEEAFGACMDPVAAAWKDMEDSGEEVPSPFEIETALAFLYFREEHCDLVLLECGMGGLTDATNVIRTTELAVITSISMDHMEYLGDTIGKIAEQKAGIIKPGASVVTCTQQPEAELAIRKACRSNGNLLAIARSSDAVVLNRDLFHTQIRWREYTVTIHLAGIHQVENAVLALAGILALRHRGYEITDGQIHAGFEKTIWTGRFTLLRKEPFFVLDGAHNPDAARNLAESLNLYFPYRRKIFLFGVYKDKQYERIASLLAPMAEVVITMETPGDPRALPAAELAETVKNYQSRVRIAGSLEEAVAMGLEEAEPEDVIVAFGSLSFAGEITRIVKEKGVR